MVDAAKLGIACFVVAASVLAPWSIPQAVPIDCRGLARLKQAPHIVVAMPRVLSSAWATTEVGRIIVTTIALSPSRTLKGQAQTVVTIRGGTVDGETLRVSELPAVDALTPGVFFIDHGEVVGYRQNVTEVTACVAR